MIKGFAATLLVAAVTTATDFNSFSIPAGAHLSDVAIAPGGKTMYLTEVIGAAHTIVVSAWDRGSWSQPKAVSFSGRWRDLEEALSPDGNTIVFASNRPANGGSKPIDAHFGNIPRPARGGNLWRASWNGTTWSTPLRLPDAINANTSTFSPALAGDGTLYFMRASGPKLTFHIFVAKELNSQYRASALAPFSDYAYSDFDPTVAPDNSFVIFSSNRPPVQPGTSGLFVTFNRNGVWTLPRFIGARIAPDGAIESRLSPDLKTLYFNTGSQPQLKSADISTIIPLRQ